MPEKGCSSCGSQSQPNTNLYEESMNSNTQTQEKPEKPENNSVIYDEIDHYAEAKFQKKEGDSGAKQIFNPEAEEWDQGLFINPLPDPSLQGKRVSFSLESNRPLVTSSEDSLGYRMHSI